MLKFVQLLLLGCTECWFLCRQDSLMNIQRKEMPSEAVCMALANVPDGEQRSCFLAVGLAHNTVCIISLDPSVSFSSVFLIADCGNTAF
jgi:splicing factor 3B subunit 3